MIDPYLYENTNTLINKLNIKDKEELELAEADFISSRIFELEKMDIDKPNDIELLMYIHFYLFQDLYSWAGEFRTINIEKYEEVLNGLSIKYAEHTEVEKKLEEVFEKINTTNIQGLQLEDLIQYVTEIMSLIWETHPFREGNTRTTILFIFKYLQKNNINIDKDLFKDHSKYVRNSLVAATFEDTEIDVYKNNTYLLKIVRDALK